VRDDDGACTVSPLRCFTSHPCCSSPTPYPPIWPEQRRRSTALLALVAPQRSGSFQDGFICIVDPPAFGRWLYCAWWLCLGSGPCLAPFQRAHVRLSRPITSPPQMSSERVRPRRTNHAPEHSENSITLLPCSTGLIVGICDFRCRGETRQTQLGRDAKHKLVRPAKPTPVISTDHIPTNKNDCLTVTQALYGRAETLSKRTKQMIPREFTRVASNLDESCGEEDFSKAWISIEWMNTCLANFTKDYKLGFCSRNKPFFCAIDPKSEGCLEGR
jgi:hypothetical protein